MPAMIEDARFFTSSVLSSDSDDGIQTQAVENIHRYAQGPGVSMALFRAPPIRLFFRIVKPAN